MRLQRLLGILEELAPLHGAEPWDKVGLAVGDPQQAVRRALLCIDLTEAVVDEALRWRVQLVVAYHPPIFEPLPRLTTGDPQQRMIMACVRRGIAIYSPHTALDTAPAGVNDWLCDGIGAGERCPLRPAAPAVEYKLVSFVPVADADRVRRAICAAGAGVIGGYTQCSFGSDGVGTFLGDAQTEPAVGRSGQLEHVPEQRLEIVCGQQALTAAVCALRQTHPYEQPAFDLYRLEPDPSARATAGQGRRLSLARPIGMGTLIRRLKRHLGTKHLEVAGHQDPDRKIAVISVCAGAGASVLLPDQQADVLVTGEMRHHDVLDAVRRDQVVVLAGHSQTERPYLAVYRRRLSECIGPGVTWKISRRDRAPSVIV